MARIQTPSVLRVAAPHDYTDRLQRKAPRFVVLSETSPPGICGDLGQPMQSSFPIFRRATRTNWNHHSIRHTETLFMTMFSTCPFETPLPLSDRERQSMRKLAQRCVNETLTDYEHVLASKSGLPSSTRWKPVKRKENVVVYQDLLALEEIKRRKRKARSLGDAVESSHVNDLARSVGPGVHRSSATTLDRAANAEPKEMPKMIWMGTVECELDDLMYGLVSESDEVTRINSSYSGNNVQDFATLATLENSTPSDPFHSLQLKWEVNSALTKAKPVWRCRDFVYMEATGVTTSRATGQRIGYQILHSLDVRGVPELPGRKLTRGKITIYQLFRQKSKGTVEVFAKAVVNLAGGVPASVASFATAEAAGSVRKAARCARKRKLNWLLTTAKTNSPGYAAVRNDSCCSVCSRDLHSNFTHKIHECRICTKRVCHRCHVSQKLNFVKPDEASFVVMQKTLDLCTGCVHTATQTNARRIALEERALGNPVSMYWYPSRGKQGSIESSVYLEEYDVAHGSVRGSGRVTRSATFFNRATKVFSSIA